MPIRFIGTANGGTGSSTSFSITLPATQGGDIIILEYTHRGTGDATLGGTYTGPAFAEKHDQQYATSTFSGKTLWSRATGDHAGQTVTGTGLTNSCAAIVTVYRGALNSGDPLADATIVGEQNASGNETQAQISNATAGAFIVLVVANSPDLAVATQACTDPGALTERAEVLSTAGTDTSIAHASAEKASTGGTGSLTWTQTDGASGSWAYAITPAPTNAPTPRGNGHSSAGRAAVAALAWTLAPVLLWQNGFTIPEAVAEPYVPPSREWVEIVRQQWEPPEHQAWARRFVPTEFVAAQADAPIPGYRPWLRTALAAWEQPPILIWQNGVLASSGVDQVATGRRWLNAVVQAWEPPELQREPRRFVPQEAAAAAEKVPYVRVLPRGWEALNWDAQRAPLLRPATPDNPPPQSRRLAPVLDDELQPRQARRFAPPQPAAAAEQAPHRRTWLGPVAQWERDEWSAPAQRKLAQGTAAQVDSPSPGYRPWLKTALDSWAPAPVLLWQNGILAQSGVDQVAVDRPWLATVVRAWEPAAHEGQRRARVVESGAAPQVDAPPPRSRRGLFAALASWEQQLVPLWGGFGVQPETFEPGLRKWLATALRAWEPAEYAIPRTRKLVQVAAAAVNNPPFGLKRWLPTVHLAWQQTWGAQTTRHVVQSGAAPDQKTPYARGWRAAVQGWLEPTWSAQTTRHLVQGTPSDVPPFGLRSWNAALQQWKPDTWPAQGWHKVVQAAIVDPPPPSRRAWLTNVAGQWEVTWTAQAAQHTDQGIPIRGGRTTLSDRHRTPTSVSDRHRSPTDMSDRTRTRTDMDDIA